MENLRRFQEEVARGETYPKEETKEETPDLREIIEEKAKELYE